MAQQQANGGASVSSDTVEARRPPCLASPSCSTMGGAALGKFRTLGCEGLFKTMIEVDTKLRESPIVGLPITSYRPGTRGSQQYRELAQELTEYVREKNQQAA